MSIYKVRTTPHPSPPLPLPFSAGQAAWTIWIYKMSYFKIIPDSYFCKFDLSHIQNFIGDIHIIQLEDYFRSIQNVPKGFPE